jgi:catechol 2,3-dioxygenase-like lactoylglutathione lyase family enzyme
MKLLAVLLDCADPPALAGFYQRATGWDVVFKDDDYIYLGDPRPRMGFQRVAGYQPPNWPDVPAHAHLDFTVPDLEAAAKDLAELGATRIAPQPCPEKWLVFTDPEGHAFCILPPEPSGPTVQET